MCQCVNYCLSNVLMNSPQRRCSLRRVIRQRYGVLTHCCEPAQWIHGTLHRLRPQHAQPSSFLHVRFWKRLRVSNWRIDVDVQNRMVGPELAPRHQQDRGWLLSSVAWLVGEWIHEPLLIDFLRSSWRSWSALERYWYPTVGGCKRFFHPWLFQLLHRYKYIHRMVFRMYK